MRNTVGITTKFHRHFLQTLAVVCALLITGVPTKQLQAADPPILMRLEYRAADGERVQAEIKAVGGEIASPLENKTQTKWAIRGGDAINTVQRPNDRTVEIYKGSGIQRILLCNIGIRYFRDQKIGGWAPRYQLNEQALLKRNGESWKPVFETQGVPSLVVLTGASLPNAEGFYPSLEFGMTTSKMTIDSWVAR